MPGDELELIAIRLDVAGAAVRLTVAGGVDVAAATQQYSGRLLEPARARVVRPRRRMGNTTDGPFAETKEHIGGFYIIEATDLDAAVEWASKVTDAIDTPIEVRPFMEVPNL